MGKSKKTLLMIIFVAASVSIVLLFSIKNKQEPEIPIFPNYEDVEIPTKETKSLEDEIYNDIIGNLSNYIDKNEENQIKDFIKEIASLGHNEVNKKSDIYKEIVKILDQVTARCCDVANLEKYKKYYNSVTDEQNLEILSKYEIKDNGTIFAYVIEDEHKVLWENAKKIIPFDLIKDIKYFTPFKITQENGSNATLAGFMSPDNNPEENQQEWAIGVNINMDESQLPYILIHEYGHFISLKDAKMTLTEKLKPKAEGGDLLQNFIENCNGHIADEFEVVDESNQYLFYARHRNDFVTMYAATNFMEDFAESFARFVTDYSCDTDRLIKKRQFFENNKYLSGLKNKILENLKSNGIETVLECTN